MGHPLIEKNENIKTVLDNVISKEKKIISVFPGSRSSETKVLLPILLDFVRIMNNSCFITNFFNRIHIMST